MDASQTSELIGEYLRYIILDKTEHLTKALHDGRGKSESNPFTGEELQFLVPDSVSRLYAALAERGLHKDAEFMAVLDAAAMEIAEAPVRHLMDELQCLEENGDGGPDPEFSLALPHGQGVQMAAVIAGFERARL